MIAQGRWPRYSYFAAVALLLGMFLYVASTYSYKITRLVFSIREVSVICKGVYNPGISAELTDWLSAALKDNRFESETQEEVACSLLKQFPIVERVSWHMYKPGKLDCVLYGVQPRYIINEEWIAARGRLFRPEQFSLYTKELPRITVNKEWLSESVFPGIYDFLLKQPDLLYCVYHLFYQDPYTILLFPEQTKTLPYASVCIVDEKNTSRLVSPSKLAALCNDLKKQKNEDWMKGSAFLFDFRFERRVIGKVITLSEYKKLRGGVHD